MTVGLTHYLVLSTLLFCLGLFGVLTRRNVVAILMGIELMLNAANINLVAFNRYIAPGAVTLPTTMPVAARTSGSAAT